MSDDGALPSGPRQDHSWGLSQEAGSRTLQGLVTTPHFRMGAWFCAVATGRPRALLGSRHTGPPRPFPAISSCPHRGDTGAAFAGLGPSAYAVAPRLEATEPALQGLSAGDPSFL